MALYQTSVLNNYLNRQDEVIVNKAIKVCNKERLKTGQQEVLYSVSKKWTFKGLNLRDRFNIFINL